MRVQFIGAVRMFPIGEQLGFIKGLNEFEEVLDEIII